MNRRAALAAAALALCGGAAGAWQAPQPSGRGSWRAFSARWSVSGQRSPLATGGDRPAAVLRLSGAVAVTGGDGLRRGFLGEAIAYDDGRGTSVGRAVWTDDAGDRIYSALQGEPVETGRRVSGVITGGTGRYDGLEGEYTFVWQFVTQADDGVVQGRTVAIEGRVRGGRP